MVIFAATLPFDEALDELGFEGLQDQTETTADGPSGETGNG